MAAHFSLAKMSLEEKLEAMELLWSRSLRYAVSGRNSPPGIAMIRAMP